MSSNPISYEPLSDKYHISLQFSFITVLCFRVSVSLTCLRLIGRLPLCGCVGRAGVLPGAVLLPNSSMSCVVLQLVIVSICWLQVVMNRLSSSKLSCDL